MDPRALAHPECPVCNGNGSITRTRDNGSLQYSICQCVLYAHRDRVAKMRIRKHLGEQARRMTFAAYDPGRDARNLTALTVAQNFCNEWLSARREGWMLGFFGKPGCGKTHLATAMVIDVMRRFGTTGLVVSVPALLRDQRKSFQAKGDAATPIERATAADILVMDDIGAEYLRTRADARSDVDWVDEQLYLLLDERLRENRPTIYTTNMATNDLRQTLSERVASRIERSEVMPALEMAKVPGRALRDEAIRNRLMSPRTPGAA